MKIPSCVSTGLVAILLSGLASAQDASSPSAALPPATGVSLEATGIALGAFGVLSFATAPICKTSVVIPQEQNSCFDVSFAVGAPFLAAGIPLIVIGAIEHAKYTDWVKRHSPLLGFSFSPLAGGSAVGWRATF
jgi:hypothetical protein